MVLYTVFTRYLTKRERVDFDEKMSDYINSIDNKRYHNALIKHFDIEKIFKKPRLWEDIWIYNHCKYDLMNKNWTTGLLFKYQQEVFIKDEKEYRKELRRRKVAATN